MDEVLGAVGLTEAAHRRVGAFSLGMGQRLGIAAAPLGDPEVFRAGSPARSTSRSTRQATRRRQT
ncbi:hypothetical protein FRACA_260017 [Frankia canadensis]|uniref:ABC transporter domain-containing protein n=1 Tax=Frankia canadensis TaxID=1836972 RepID=A0A2I2KSB7_9ACTN|nr:hypothetical protein FRACA_260017 [Frankia canadensis]SOU55854.1 hypothetical protein FRACA_260017 [Frankia canadensis]